MSNQPHKTVEYLWSDTFAVRLERDLWLAVANAQHHEDPSLVSHEDLVRITRATLAPVDLEAIREREKITKHDLKARLEIFAEMIGSECVHLGMTSADVVENTCLIRQRKSIQCIRDHMRLEGQPVGPIDLWLNRQQFRGIRGAIGTEADIVELIGKPGLDRLNNRLMADYGFKQLSIAPTQNHHRSADLDLMVLITQLVSGPHQRVIQGLVTSAAEMQPWLEGDVSTSVVRRYIWPAAFYTWAQYIANKVKE